MRVVVDTNIIISGLLNAHGPPGRILDLLTGGRLVPLFDDRIFDEYAEVLRRRRFGFPESAIQALLDHIQTSGEPVVACPVTGSTADPSDLPFLEVALAGEAEVLITGNPRHFASLAKKHNIRICSPRDFLEQFAA